MTGCPDPDCHVDFMDVFRAYVQRGRWARAWKTEAQILARRNRELTTALDQQRVAYLETAEELGAVRSERDAFEEELERAES